MTFLRVLHAEMLKMKRTIALKMVLIAPLTVSLLIFFMAANSPFSVVILRSRGGSQWLALSRLNLLVWAALMLPLFITMETALISGLDHAENQWKNLFARPVPRWTFYFAKLLVVMAMTAASATVLLFGVLAAGAILARLPLSIELNLGLPVPWDVLLRESAEVTGLAFLALTIQHWVSLRWHAFSVGIGVGILATVAGYLMLAASRQTDGWERYFPWSLPMLVTAPTAQHIEAALWIGVALGLLVSALGCWDFCRREVK
jgi:hypothetical protein